jgi:hypothetical protein
VVVGGVVVVVVVFDREEEVPSVQARVVGSGVWSIAVVVIDVVVVVLKRASHKREYPSVGLTPGDTVLL